MMELWNVVKYYIRKIYEFLARPFTEDFAMLLLISILVCVPTIWGGYIIDKNALSSVAWEAAHNFILCYFAMFLITCIPLRAIKRVGKGLLVLLAVIDFMIEIACWKTKGCGFSNDIVAITLATNIKETHEFVGTYISYSYLISIVVSIICLFGVVKKMAPMINRVGCKIAKFACVIIFISCGYFVLKGSESWQYKFYNKIVAFVSYDLPPDLRDYKKSLKLEFSKADIPQYIVLVLGESFSRSHSSLYGYEKETNPFLSILRDSSALCVYDNALAPATHTIPCVKSIMSTYKAEYRDSINWYECVSLPQVMSEIGYKTIWISNQSPSGVYDNVAARYAQLCDTTIYVGNKYVGVGKTDLDAKVLDVIREDHILNTNDNCFIVIHLMGSHSSYSNRYPLEWSKFSSADYMRCLENQRQVLAEYDNSVLYNDFVVSEIFKILSDKECISYYFSDHSLDLFESSDNYFGYAKENNNLSKKASLSIPYMIFGSPSFRNNFPTEWYNIKSNASNTIYTEDTIQYIMDMLGVKF